MSWCWPHGTSISTSSSNLRLKQASSFKALALAGWRRNVFITIETRCNVLGLVRIEPLHSFQEPPLWRVAAISRLLVPPARDAHRQFMDHSSAFRSKTKI
jgi:hypothetical protein